MKGDTLKEIIKENDQIVFFGGAGVSTESGIPDFRSEAGLYAAMTEYGRPAEELICRPFFERNPEVFFDYYKKNLLYPDARPNAAHYGLAQLEREGKVKAVITQNIDGLHQMAGSRNVIELHGSTLRNYCVDCKRNYKVDYVANADGIPRCETCGGIVRPDVVLYQESLDNDVIEQAVSAIKNAAVLIVGGTSLVVYPAAGMVQYFNGNHLVLINKSETQYDKNADLVIHEAIGSVFEKLHIF